MSSDYKFEVGREYRTRSGRRCVILANDLDVGMCWKVEHWDGRGWFLQTDNSCLVLGDANDPLRPVPPEQTVEPWCHVVDGVIVYRSGEPMYRVEPVTKGGAVDDRTGG